MQRIERYGVIALVFLLVTIMAVALWGQREEQGLLSFMKKGKPPADGAEQPSRKVALPIAADRRASSRLPIGVRQEEVAATAGSDDRARDALHDSASRNYAPPSSARALPPPDSGRAAQLRGPSRQAAPPAPGPIASAVAQAPARSDAPTPAKLAPQRGQVVVRHGETLSHIAQRELGSARRWRDILALNPGLDPRRMHEGTPLNMPARELIAQTPSAPIPVSKVPAGRVNGSGKIHPRGYTVRSGDTLSQIALDELGRASRWKEIVELNPGLDPEQVPAGTRIVLPAGPPAPVLAKAPTEPAPNRSQAIARATSSGRRVR